MKVASHPFPFYTGHHSPQFLLLGTTAQCCGIAVNHTRIQIISGKYRIETSLSHAQPVKFNHGGLLCVKVKCYMSMMLECGRRSHVSKVFPILHVLHFMERARYFVVMKMAGCARSPFFMHRRKVGFDLFSCSTNDFDLWVSSEQLCTTVRAEFMISYYRFTKQMKRTEGTHEIIIDYRWNASYRHTSFFCANLRITYRPTAHVRHRGSFPMIIFLTDAFHSNFNHRHLGSQFVVHSQRLLHFLALQLKLQPFSGIAWQWSGLAKAICREESTINEVLTS